MDLQTLALDLQEVFLLMYGWLLFWGLVIWLAATLGLVILLPFLSIDKEERG